MRSPLIQSIFGPTIQGEGPLIGRQCVFVRTGGCDYRCQWCDTMYAVDPKRYGKTWALMNESAIVSRVAEIAGAAKLVVISGGNPAMQPLGPLCEALQDQGFAVSIETQGSIFPEWAREPDYWVVSPKPPSSGERPDVETLRQFQGLDNVHFKVPVMDDTDLSWAVGLKHDLGLDEMYIQPVNRHPEARLKNPMAQIEGLQRLVAASIDRAEPGLICLPQLHVLLWGNEKDV